MVRFIENGDGEYHLKSDNITVSISRLGPNHNDGYSMSYKNSRVRTSATLHIHPEEKLTIKGGLQIKNLLNYSPHFLRKGALPRDFYDVAKILLDRIEKIHPQRLNAEEPLEFRLDEI